jgi:hypothetical protein
MDDTTRGLYKKYNVTRADGSSEPGGKHRHCDYFVLDLVHDPYAIDALQAYAIACRRDYPALSESLENRIWAMVRNS